MESSKYIYLWLLILLVITFISIVYATRRSKDTKILDIILIWPLLTRNTDNAFNNKFVWGGLLIMISLIIISQFIYK